MTTPRRVTGAPPAAPPLILAGDVGATHTRLAVFGADPRVPAAFESYASQDHAGLAEMVRAFLASHPAGIGAACFGVAGTIQDGRARAVNLAWPADAASLAGVLGLTSVGLINDLAANAYGIASLTAADLETLNQGTRALRPGGGAVPVPGRDRGPRELRARVLGAGAAERPKLRDGTFLRAFTGKGRFASLLARVPVQVIRNDRAVLLGAASCARAAGPAGSLVTGPPGRTPHPAAR